MDSDLIQSLELLDPNDISDHIYDLYIESQPEPNQDLGYVNRKHDDITIHIPRSNIELNIKQSLSQLSSSIQTSSTGFVCWRTSPRLMNWILTDPKCPFYKYFQVPSLNVVELGSGVGGVCASVLGTKCLQYICTDQKHILKLLKQNISNNVDRFQSSTIDVECKDKNLSKIEVIEFDWENPDQGLYNYYQITEEFPDLILACDTVYNEYLIEPFMNSLKTLMGPNTGALIAIQMRDENILETFVISISTQFKVYYIPEELLSVELTKGFVIYYVRGFK